MTRRLNIYSIVNVIVGGLVSLIGCLPIIYRYLLFNKSGFVMPYSFGRILTLIYIRTSLLIVVVMMALPYENQDYFGWWWFERRLFEYLLGLSEARKINPAVQKNSVRASIRAVIYQLSLKYFCKKGKYEEYYFFSI